MFRNYYKRILVPGEALFVRRGGFIPKGSLDKESNEAWCKKTHKNFGRENLNRLSKAKKIPQINGGRKLTKTDSFESGNRELLVGLLHVLAN